MSAARRRISKPVFCTACVNYITLRTPGPFLPSQSGFGRLTCQSRHPTRISVVDESGAVFGEISALLDLPHSAEVFTLAPSQFYVANASLIGHNAAALFYVAG